MPPRLKDKHLVAHRSMPPKPSGWETLLRKMTPTEYADLKAGWAASTVRRRRGLAGLGLRASELEVADPEAEGCELDAAA